MRLFTETTVCSVAAIVFVVLCLAACGGSDGDNKETVEGLTLMGTCEYPSTPNSPADYPVCKEIWLRTESAVGPSVLRESHRQTCEDNDDPPGEWTSNAANCPTDGGYIGTCEVQNSASAQEHYFYAPADQKEQREDCPGKWYVE